MQYRIVNADSQSDLESLVRALIAEGWKPQGGVSAAALFDSEPTYYVSHWEYNQAMIKEDEADG